MSPSADATPSADRIEALIEGQVTGQVAVGKHILQVGPVYGGVVNIAAPGQRAAERLRARPRPVQLLPRAATRFLDREAELDPLSKSLTRGTPTDLYARDGMGKTTLVRRLAHSLPNAPFPDGVVYLSARHLALDDFLHDLLMAFYESDVPVRLTRSQIRARLAQVRALILVDDVDWPREDVDALLDAAPQAAFLITGKERHLWGEGARLHLKGLPREAGMALLAQELGRALTATEQKTARGLVDALGGHPLSIVQVAGQVADGRLTLEQALARARSDRARPDRGAAAAAFSALSEEDRRLLSALAALRDIPLDAHLLGAIAGVPNTEERLRQMEQRGLVQSHSPRYTVAANVADALADAPALAQWRARAVESIMAWAKAYATDYAHLASLAPTCLRTLDWLSEQGRWQDVLALARLLDTPLSLYGRWVAWEHVLQRALEAATHLGDQAARAWALHQLGTRALALGDKGGAEWLREALALRQRLGDRAGAAITQHNLSVFLPPPPPPPPAKPTAPPARGGIPALFKIIVGVVLVGAIALAGLRVLSPPPSPQPPRKVVPAPTPTPTRPPSPTPTFTPRPVILPTRTPTPTLPPAGEIQPEVSITIKGECGWQFDVGTTVRVKVATNVKGRVYVTLLLYGDPVEGWEVTVTPREPAFILWRFQQSGEYVFRAQFLDSRDQPLAEATCPVYVYEAAPPPPTFTPTPTLTPAAVVLFDFVAEAPGARWYSDAGTLDFPGSLTDERGFVLWREDACLEDDTCPDLLLETHPQWVPEGYIIGLYPATENIFLQPGDRFVARVGLLKNARAGDVWFQVWFDMCSSNEFPPLVGEIHDTYDGNVLEWEIPLDEYVGWQGCFALAVRAGETAAQDWAAWVEARIERP